MKEIEPDMQEIGPEMQEISPETEEISPEKKEPAAKGGVPAAPGAAPAAEELVRSMGLVFHDTFLYGADHSVTKKAIEDCFVVLARLLESCEEVSFSITDEGLLVNDDTVEQRNPLLRAFVSHVNNLEIDSFSLRRGMTQQEFNRLIDIMGSKPKEVKQSGWFSAALADSGLKNVRTKKVSYQRVSEEEQVVSKEELEGAGVERAEKAEAEPVVSKEAGAGEEGANVAGILAFLKGDISGEDEGAVKSVQEVASDAHKLGELIMRSAEVRQESADIEGGESFEGLVVGCLRRAQEGLMKDPSIKTQKGKKKLAKTLMLLEKDILDRMREMSGGLADEDAEMVSDAIEEMTDELKIDALADEYMKKRNAIDTSEKRILRFIKTKGPDKIDETDLQEKLSGGGLSPEGWQELVVKSGAGEGGGVGFGEGGGGMAAIGHLASLLTRMEENIAKEKEKTGEETAEVITGVLTEVDKEVTNLVARTEHKIDDLVKTVKADEKAKKPGLSRKKLLVLLAEIVQELCQPLAVINCSIDMIRSNNLGAVTEQQGEMLNLASSSGERLRKLIDRLMEISGVPTTMQPDAAIQASLY